MIPIPTMTIHTEISAEIEALSKALAKAWAMQSNAYLDESGHPQAEMHKANPEAFAGREWPKFAVIASEISKDFIIKSR